MPPENTLARSQYSFKLAFYYRATLCVSAVFAVDRCLSVCPSVTFVHSIHTASNFSVGVVAHHSSFFDRSAGTQFQGNPFSGVQSTRGVGKFCDFLLKSPSISETERDKAYGCYGTVIGSHMRCIEWWHSQWPSLTLNPVFKVPSFLKPNISKQCTIWTKLYRIVIGNHI